MAFVVWWVLWIVTVRQFKITLGFNSRDYRKCLSVISQNCVLLLHVYLLSLCQQIYIQYLGRSFLSHFSFPFPFQLSFPISAFVTKESQKNLRLGRRLWRPLTGILERIYKQIWGKLLNFIEVCWIHAPRPSLFISAQISVCLMFAWYSLYINHCLMFAWHSLYLNHFSGTLAFKFQANKREAVLISFNFNKQ